jgi:hypothetical protein
MTYALKSRQIKSGTSKGKSVYFVLRDNVPIFSTKPLTAEESLPLRRLVKDPHQIQEWINKHFQEVTQ